MSRILPILFNTDMVRAILENRKTVTRRIIKGNVAGVLNSPYHKEHPEAPDKLLLSRLCKAPYDQGDILYVRETWAKIAGKYIYRADHAPATTTWHPSVHMPKEAARIWLNVMDVRVERLQDITQDQVVREGITELDIEHLALLGEHYDIPFAALWNSTIKKKDIALYGWGANPWVWVVEFERSRNQKN